MHGTFEDLKYGKDLGTASLRTIHPKPWEAQPFDMEKPRSLQWAKRFVRALGLQEFVGDVDDLEQLGRLESARL